MHIAHKEEVTRFIRKNRHCKSDRIRGDAFLPKYIHCEISVYFIAEFHKPRLEDHEIWKLACKLTEPAVARADLYVSAIIEKIGLPFIPDDPYTGHANIRIPALPDPSDHKNEVNYSAKRSRSEYADKLAEASRLSRLPK